MDKWNSAISVTYKRWRNPDQSMEAKHVDGTADCSGSIKDEGCVTIGGLTLGRRKSACASVVHPKQETFTLDEALDALGFGMFQWKLLFLTGFSWVADAMEMMILSILGPQLHCDWSLEGYKVALVTSVVFAGMGFSSSFWGNLSDKHGRKKWLPESPRFDLLNGNVTKVMATLERIAKDNGKALPPGRMVCNLAPNSRGRLSELFTRRYCRTMLLLLFIWFSFAFAYYGIILLTTEMFQSGDWCGVTQGAKNEAGCRLGCKLLTSEDYKDLLWTTLAEFPGLVVVLGTVDCLGRKKSMALPLFIFTLSLVPLYACIGRVALTVFIFIGRAFISGGYQVAFVYTPEVFPTETRALAVGTCSAMARVGALITPFVAQVLLRHSVSLTLSVYCLCSFLAGVLCLLLPIETSGRALQESERTPTLSAAKRLT
ncbi:synaptic vesicle 2-related protein isoform X4 [Syngnathus acus]|uniref:synaptic vesicle 2-related protein isoform X4 n=1 Tax=Syngnathus acus TaxID=161584 RepID=UPI001885B7F6|nr:synaptic vesicle 2-related protein isoform X4 [Syngnathus acus]